MNLAMDIERRSLLKLLASGLAGGIVLSGCKGCHQEPNTPRAPTIISRNPRDLLPLLIRFASRQLASWIIDETISFVLRRLDIDIWEIINEIAGVSTRKSYGGHIYRTVTLDRPSNTLRRFLIDGQHFNDWTEFGEGYIRTHINYLRFRDGKGKEMPNSSNLMLWAVARHLPHQSIFDRSLGPGVPVSNFRTSQARNGHFSYFEQEFTNGTGLLVIDRTNQFGANLEGVYKRNLNRKTWFPGNANLPDWR